MRIFATGCDLAIVMKLFVLRLAWMKSNILQVIYAFWAWAKVWSCCNETNSSLTTKFSG